MVADFNVYAGRRIKYYIYARTELDEADALAALEAISNLGVKNDAARQKARDLLENHGLAVAFDGNDVLLVLVSGGDVHSIQILAPLVADVANHAGDGGAVHVHVEYVEKNAESGLLSGRQP